MKQFRPMLAIDCDDLDKLIYPVLATPKIDGIRCIVKDGLALSRSLKPIQNRYVSDWISRNCPSGFDGELFIDGANFNEVSSAIMSFDGEPDFVYKVFDIISFKYGYSQRVNALKVMQVSCRVQKILPVIISTSQELEQYSKSCIADGYEGAIARSPNGPYKQGRSTVREGYMIKVKPFIDSDAVVLGFKELMHNGNEVFTNELGLSKRSSAKDGKIASGMLGAFHVKDVHTGLEFDIGSGLDNETRITVWKNRDRFIGAIIKYKSQEIGSVNKPRIPIFLGFRSIPENNTVNFEKKAKKHIEFRG